jgi:uncharacterized protein (DUF1330 family)
MTAYLIVQIQWHDLEIQKEYRSQLGATLEMYGGRILCAGDPIVLEGTWNPGRAVLLEFPTMDSLRQWYRSVEYAPLIELRKRGAHTNMIAVDAPAY